jgi:hypothetical protein
VILTMMINYNGYFFNSAINTVHAYFFRIKFMGNQFIIFWFG